ncbi:histidine decarboxylase [Beggiatoa leptomitoformis]|uniref:Histidine decarboxylase n=1 Tax=Beggiatoa leptomitoformis TaxID=288004 RepID=A0A2N9YFW0_9GAMM|nr:histidine decarboxylase [Beggiatoa leptomitoformis]ALG68291.1 histidine decarboxylase [Beggiatoa leptomitoformis]AUI69398.1 histidine decarboxylase [Beggiatoa leptomitoformis]
MSFSDLMVTRRLQAFVEQVIASPTPLGYPLNSQLDITPLQALLTLPLHNVGDPWSDHSRRHPSHEFEREVLRFIADIYQFPTTETLSGYVTSGGTEGNLYGLYMGREAYPDGILYYSADSHYSISKSARLLKLPSCVVPSQAQGELDYKALAACLSAEHPAIIVLNIGTTMKGAIDDIEKVLVVLQEKKIQHFYIHCDAALFGMILPFIPHATYPLFTQPIDSLSISGHKFLGSPMPCGIVLCRAKATARIAQPIAYIDTLDSTLSGCRNGHTPLILWYALHTKGHAGLQAEVQQCLANALYLERQLQAFSYPFLRNPHSIIVLFKKPAKAIIDKWQLAVEGDWAHVVVMQQVTSTVIDAFLQDLLGAG